MPAVAAAGAPALRTRGGVEDAGGWQGLAAGDGTNSQKVRCDVDFRSRYGRALTSENFRQDAKLKDIGSTSQSRLDAAISSPEVAKEMAQTAAKKRLEELKAIARDPPKPRAQVVK
jgi:hypothetical protein